MMSPSWLRARPAPRSWRQAAAAAAAAARAGDPAAGRCRRRRGRAAARSRRGGWWGRAGRWRVLLAANPGRCLRPRLDLSDIQPFPHLPSTLDRSWTTTTMMTFRCWPPAWAAAAPAAAWRRWPTVRARPRVAAARGCCSWVGGGLTGSSVGCRVRAAGCSLFVLPGAWLSLAGELGCAHKFGASEVQGAPSCLEHPPTCCRGRAHAPRGQRGGGAGERRRLAGAARAPQPAPPGRPGRRPRPGAAG